MKNKILLCLFASLLMAGCGRGSESTNNTTDSTIQQENVLQETDSLQDAVLKTEDVLEWEDKSITIPGLKDDYEIWYLSDCHITLQDGTEDAQTAEYAAGRASVFRNDNNVSGDIIFSEFITEANEEQPDLILFGGDIIDFPSKANVDFLQKELERLTIPYVFTMGNHDWTFPWAYMNEEGAAAYRPLLESYMYGNFENADGAGAVGNTYFVLAEFEDFVVLSVDNSSNQVDSRSVEGMKQAYSLNKPIILLQHVPFSTEDLITEAKKEWANPVTLGMQVHGGIAPNDSSAFFWEKVHAEDSLIKVILAGHVHFDHEEVLTGSTRQIVTDAAFKGMALELEISGQYQYFCDGFILTANEKQYDLSEIDPKMSSVSELLPITNDQLYILGRIDEKNNTMMIYDFIKEEFVFHEQGSTLCWVQDEFDTVRYLKDNVVYDLDGNVIYEPDDDSLITLIEYVETDFKVSIADLNHENPQEIWIE